MSGGSERERLAEEMYVNERNITYRGSVPLDEIRSDWARQKDGRWDHVKIAYAQADAALAHVAEERARLVAALRGMRAWFDRAHWTSNEAVDVADSLCSRVDALLADPAAATPDDEIDQVWAHTIEECALIAEAHGAASAAEAIRAKLIANERAATPDATVHHADRISSAGVVTPSCRPGVLGDGDRASMDAAKVTCVECRRVIAAPDATGGGA